MESRSRVQRDLRCMGSQRGTGRQSHALEYLGKLHQALVLCFRGPVSGDAEVQHRRETRSKRRGHRLSKRIISYGGSRRSSNGAKRDMALREWR